MNNQCVIYDNDQRYAMRLMSAINSSKTVPFGAQIFTKEKELCNYLENNSPEILMVSEDSYSYELGKHHEGRTIVLCDQRDNIYHTKDEYGDNTVGVYKYQSSDKILKEIINNSNNRTIRQSKDIKILGIYSTSDCEEKNSVALMMAAELSSYYQVLYLNLDEFTGLDQLLISHTGMTLSDALYFYKLNEYQYTDRIENTIEQISNFDYIAPVRCAEDISYISSSKILQFVEDVAKHRGYDCVVIDISSGVKQPWKLIGECNQVLMVTNQNYMASRRLQSFEKFYIESGMEGILDRIRKVDVTGSDLQISEHFFENWMNSSLYNNIREFANGV